MISFNTTDMEVGDVAFVNIEVKNKSGMGVHKTSKLVAITQEVLDGSHKPKLHDAGAAKV